MPTSSVEISIQERDIELLQLLLHSRIMTLAHAAVLIFGGSKEAAKKRLQKLKANGLVLERRRKAYEQGVLFLSKKGFLCLKERGALPPECADIPSFSKRAAISELTLRHELEVMDVKAAFYREAANLKNITIAEFSTWPRLYEFTVNDDEDGFGKLKTVKPDGFIRIHEIEGGATWEYIYFLEVDRSTERLETLIEKFRLYSLFYRSGGLSKKFGRGIEEYRSFPFQILVVCRSEARVNNLTAVLNLSSTLSGALIASSSDVCHNPFSEVWVTPKEVNSANRQQLLHHSESLHTTNALIDSDGVTSETHAKLLF